MIERETQRERERDKKRVRGDRSCTINWPVTKHTGRRFCGSYNEQAKQDGEIEPKNTHAEKKKKKKKKNKKGDR